MSLLLIGFQINRVVGIVTTIIFVVLLSAARTLARKTFGTPRRKPSS